MKIMLGDTPVTITAHNVDISTDDATIVASDMQVGMVAYAKNQRVVGTGKAFNFAYYGEFETNDKAIVPDNINMIEIASLEHPIKITLALKDMKLTDFLEAQTIGNVVVNGNNHAVTVRVENNELFINCDETVLLQVFYGKDDHV